MFIYDLIQKKWVDTLHFDSKIKRFFKLEDHDKDPVEPLIGALLENGDFYILYQER